MNGLDYILFLDLDKKIRFLLNEKNSEITYAFFDVELVPKDQSVKSTIPSKTEQSSSHLVCMCQL